jgi:hypothetical protein
MFKGLDPPGDDQLSRPQCGALKRRVKIFSSPVGRETPTQPRHRVNPAPPKNAYPGSEGTIVAAKGIEQTRRRPNPVEGMWQWRHHCSHPICGSCASPAKSRNHPINAYHHAHSFWGAFQKKEGGKAGDEKGLDLVFLSLIS